MTVHINHEDRRAHSPSYREGLDDGWNDCLIVAQCPPGVPLGMQEAPHHGRLYAAGYDYAWRNACPHRCTAACKQREQ